MLHVSAGIRSRLAGSGVAAIGVLFASAGAAQQWSVYAGAAGRVEYNDNYFFTAPGQTTSGNPNLTVDPESATTLSLVPFVAASRRTEVSEVAALLAVGWNTVWGPSPSDDYVTGRLALNGTLRDDRATWTGRASYHRESSLAQTIRGTGVTLVRAYTDTSVLEGSYNYLLTDRWTIGATVGGYADTYDSVQGTDTLNNDWGYNVAGNLAHIYSDQTRLNYALGYTYYTSDITHSSVVTTTMGIAHRVSPQLTVSGSVGGFWSDTTARQNLPGQGTPISAGENRDDSGMLFGGSVVYAFAESTQFDARASQGLVPSSTGTISEETNASVGISHRFSDRLTGRLGASYLRIGYPGLPDSSTSQKDITAAAGLSYRLAERWTLDAGYQYIRTRYAQNLGGPRSNVVFVSVAYNWPGASFTEWLGNPVDTHGLAGAGPLGFPDAKPGASGHPVGTTPPEALPFDGFVLP